MFTLCIPTMDRYENYLSKNLNKYKSFSKIDEIIISDENGNDCVKIEPCDKIKCHVNEKKLGAFFNKLHIFKYVTNDWVALIDSDNFADSDYFEVAANYMENNDIDQYSILMPSFAKPSFDYRNMQNNIVDKSNIKNFINDYSLFATLLNTGNYIINKKLIEEFLRIKKYTFSESDKILHSPVDCLLLIIMFFELFDMKLHIVENLHYEHSVHKDSFYLKEHRNYEIEIEEVFNRLKNL